MKKNSKIKWLILNITLGLYFFFSQSPALAAKCLGEGGGLGPFAEFLCNEGSDTKKVGGKLNTVISMFIGFLTIIAALFFFIQIILAGFNWISAGGDKGKLEIAQKKITYSFVGLLIVVAAYTIIGVVGKILGLNILDPGGIIENLISDL